MAFSKGLNGNTITYPLTQAQIDALNESQLVSPRVGNNHGIKRPDEYDGCGALFEVIKIREEVNGGVMSANMLQRYWPFDFTMPLSIPKPLVAEGLDFKNPSGLANVVHMDLPSQMPNAVLRWVVSMGVEPISSDPDEINFINTIPYTQEKITNGVLSALEKVFEIKYFYGYERPEERYGRFLDTSGVELTHYPEGCPNHPTFPAGHGGAAAGGVKAIIDVFGLDTDPQKAVILNEVLYTAYVWAMARSMAGVHDCVDNLAGLIAGGLSDYVLPSVVAKYTI